MLTGLVAPLLVAYWREREATQEMVQDCARRIDDSFLLTTLLLPPPLAATGVIVAIILQTKIEFVPQYADGSWPVPAMTAGYSILGAGLACGLSNLVCG